MRKPVIIFTGTAKNKEDAGSNKIQSSAMMKDHYERVFLSDPFFKLGERWIQIEPDSLVQEIIARI